MYPLRNGRLLAMTALAIGLTVLGILATPATVLAQRIDEPGNGNRGVVAAPVADGSGGHTLVPVGPARPTSVTRVNGINSPDRDNTPIVSADGTVMFFNSTRRGTRPWARRSTRENRYDDDIYVAVRSIVRRDTEDWDMPVNLGSTFNSSADDGVVAISPDGHILYFNSLKKGWENDGGPFYSAHLHGNAWSEIRGLGGGISEFFRQYPAGTGFRIYGGAVSADGRDFYFATTLYSPTNDHQIWVSHLENDRWSYPVNLGPVINGGGGSFAPFIAADGNTLFYSSNANGGVGGDDIYVTKFEGGAWSAPLNLGEPINSPDDNAFLSLPASGDRVYFSSVVDGNEDIFVAPLPTLMRPNSVVLVSGRITDRATGTPIEATITIEDLTTGKTIFKANSNTIRGDYTTVLQAGRDYGISVSAPGYVFVSDRYTISAATPYNEYRQDFELEELKKGESFTLNNVFFEYNDATLSPTSKPELDRIISLMAEHPAMAIEIHGHTDNVGSADFNLRLSLRRAEAVRDYLVGSGGIDPSRLAVRGFGFSKPVATNRTETGRHQNRRSEFTVVTM